MSNLYSTEELIINDSFISYCLNESSEEIVFWEKYIIQYPSEKETLEAAKVVVLDLRALMRRIDKENAIQDFTAALEKKCIDQNFIDTDRSAFTLVKLPWLPTNLRKWVAWTVAACFVCLVGLGVVLIYSNKLRKKNTTKQTLAQTPGKITVPEMLTIGGNGQTGKKEKKMYLLPDGTKVSLNAESTIALDRDFGTNNRQIYITGEAFFDVTHNAAKPFLVHLKDFDIRVLGTMFNVRSYSTDRSSETSLVRGKVEIKIHNSPGKSLFLKPNQKLILAKLHPDSNRLTVQGNLSPTTEIFSTVFKPLTISSDGNSIVETAWVYNRLEINDEFFENLKPKLERWFGVKIVFVGDEVKEYRFTATFENETLDQVLKALQISYNFNYEIQNDKILIRK